MPDSDYEQIFTYSITQRKLNFRVFKKIPYAMYATSGRGRYMNDPDAIAREDYGPIPVGEYIIHPNELNDPNFLWDYFIRNFFQDWGDWRVPLHPEPSTNTFGRSGFFIHGGSTEGSKGCIDIGGGVWGWKGTDLLKDVVIKARKPILLRVTE